MKRRLGACDRLAIVSGLFGVLGLACGSAGQERAGEASAEVQRAGEAVIVESAFTPATGLAATGPAAEDLAATGPAATDPAAEGLAAEDPSAATVDRERLGGEQVSGQNHGVGDVTDVEAPGTRPPDEGANAERGGSALGIIGGGSETGALGEEEGAPKSRVKVHLRKVLGTVDRAAIARLITAVAKSCHRRTLDTEPRSAGRLELEFKLVGDYKGPTRVKIGGEESSPKLASCLRRRMGEERWPTGQLDGVGVFVIGIDFSVEQLPG